MTVPLRAALYLRVSTARQAEHDVSIPDQKRQGEAYCALRGYQLVETYVEPGASATNDRRPEFQRMIEAGTSKPAPFDVVIVHSFSRFFRDAFDMEFYVRKLAKNGVKLLSITQEIGDDPVHQMMRQIMALFDEYQSKENAKHVMRALKENARQGFWNGSLPPIGYRVVAAEQRGAKVKKKLEIDPLHAETVRLIYRLALHGDGAKGQMGVKNIVSHLNRNRIFTRDGGRWGIGQVHRILTRRTYMGEHEFNKRSKSKALKPVSEIVVVPVPPIIDRETFDAVQALLKARHPSVTPSAVISGPTLLTGLIHCAKCGGAMTIRTGKGGRYRYYACSTKARQGPTACEGMAVPMDKLDDLVASHLEERLLQPERLETILATVLDRRQERSERQREHIAKLNRRAAEAEARLKRLYDAIEAGIADLGDPALKDRIDGLKASRDQAKADAERAQAMLQNSGSQAVTPQMLRKFARAARQRIRLDGGGYRRDHVRALAQRVEVADREVRIIGSKSNLLQTLTAAAGVRPAALGVRSSVPKWRRGGDSNPRYPYEYAAFRVRCFQPLSHLSRSRFGARGPGRAKARNLAMRSFARKAHDGFANVWRNSRPGAVIARGQRLGRVAGKAPARVRAETGGLPMISPIQRAVAIRASTFSPVSSPARCNIQTRSSVATLPEAPGAKGQPPRPPQLASSTRTPASTAAKALARAAPRVSWKWARRPVRGAARRAASNRRRTFQGSAAPMVSARAVSGRSRTSASSTISITAPSSTSPSKGQPNATETVSVIGGPPRAF